MDHLTSTPNFTLQHLRFLVIDEADRLLNQSFQNWLSKVLLHLRPPTTGIPEGHKRLAWDTVAASWAQAYGLVPLPLDPTKRVIKPSASLILLIPNIAD
jgi:ATP-dependent RNA helicase DDX51/DBP6